MLRRIKRKLYFFVAAYFLFFARFYLRRWNPQVITVIGSSGKTTILHLLEAQIGVQARYSHKANSAFGIPFHILGLDRKTFHPGEWLLFFILAPFQAIRPVHKEKLYVTEADAERPGEAKVLATLLRPDILIWLSLEEAHGINFDSLVKNDVHDVRDAVKKEMAREFGYFVANTQKLIVAAAENPYIEKELERAEAEITRIQQSDSESYELEKSSTKVSAHGVVFSVPALVPPQAAISIVAALEVTKYLGLQIDQKFSRFVLPPGRSSVFAGIKDTTLIDSSYNATIDGVRTMLDLMNRYPAAGAKWLVLGDMIEQGKSEELEHADLAKLIVALVPDRVIFVGPRLQKYTHPVLVKMMEEKNIAAFLMPGEALKYLQENLRGGETILFKGARFLEGIVEQLLADPKDARKLCRREEVWVKRRKEWGI
jgi:UDP-N-acetylmuramoyl-tripeptide--D-alanyl-D-alanine ligase